MNYSDVQKVLSKDNITRDDIISLCELVPYDWEVDKIYKFGEIYLYFESDTKRYPKPDLVLHAVYEYMKHNAKYLSVYYNGFANYTNYTHYFNNFRNMSLREQLEWLVKVNKLQQACKLKIKLLTKQL